MGGTSTDVSRYDGDYEHVFESTTAGVVIQAPQVQYLYVLLPVETFPFYYPMICTFCKWHGTQW